MNDITVERVLKELSDIASGRLRVIKRIRITRERGAIIKVDLHDSRNAPKRARKLLDKYYQMNPPPL